MRRRLELVGEGLDEVRAAQRIGRLGDAGLVGEDLLGPEGQPRADSSVGRASASSRALVCRLCAPPRTAASAWTVVRTTLLSTDWAVSEEPAVCTWKRHTIERAFDDAEPITHDPGPHPARRPELGDLLEQLGPGGEEEARRGRRSRRSSSPRASGRLDVRDRVGEREGQLLRGRRAGLAHVVAADARSCSSAAARAPPNSKTSVTRRIDGPGG